MIDPVPVPDFSNPREKVSFGLGMVVGAISSVTLWLASVAVARLLIAAIGGKP